MSFTNTVLTENLDLPAGEVLKSKPHNVEAFEVFENGLVEGRFAKLDAGSVDNLDASATPQIVGIVKRKITGEIGTGIYSTTGQEIDSVAEIINFGFATVEVTAAATPAKYDAVNVVNAAGADAGKATNDAVDAGPPAIISAGDVVFWEQKAAGVWLVRFNQYV